jgi:hypothetical protein
MVVQNLIMRIHRPPSIYLENVLRTRTHHNHQIHFRTQRNIPSSSADWRFEGDGAAVGMDGDVHEEV